MSNQNGFASVSYQWHVGLFNVTANQALTNTNANIAVIFYLSDIFEQQTRKQRRLGGESCDYKRFRLNKILAVNLWFEMPLMILAGKLEISITHCWWPLSSGLSDCSEAIMLCSDLIVHLLRGILVNSLIALSNDPFFRMKQKISQ